MVESMFFDLTLANVAIVDWICWKAGSLEQNQLLWHRVSKKPCQVRRGHCGGWMKWFHLNGSTISMTASILPVSVPSAGQKLQIPCVSKMARTSNGGKNHRFIVFQIMLSQAFPRAPTRLLPTWRVTAETCWAIEPTIPQYEWKTEMWVEPLTHQQYWRSLALPNRKHKKKNTQPTIKNGSIASRNSIRDDKTIIRISIPIWDWSDWIKTQKKSIFADLRPNLYTGGCGFYGPSTCVSSWQETAGGVAQCFCFAPRCRDAPFPWFGGTK
jgi:hypothetical protein